LINKKEYLRESDYFSKQSFSVTLLSSP
jgi:hypothetical protein